MVNKNAAKTMFWRLVPGIAHVVVHTSEQPPDPEWEEYLASITPHDAKTIKGLLVYTSNVGPNATQRSRATSHFEPIGVTPQMAIMTTSRIVRGIVTALSWVFGPKIRAFTTTDFQGAADSLNLNESERAEVSVVLVELAREAGVQINLPPEK